MGGDAPPPEEPAPPRSAPDTPLGSKAPILERAREPRRTALLASVVRHLEASAIDDALDVFVLLMQVKLLNVAKRATDKEWLASRPRLAKASRIASTSRSTVLRLTETPKTSAMTGSSSTGTFCRSRSALYAHPALRPQREAQAAWRPKSFANRSEIPVSGARRSTLAANWAATAGLMASISLVHSIR